MKKVLSRRLLESSVEKLNKLRSGEGVSVYREPIVPSDCRTYNRATAEFIRNRIDLYLRTWVIPNIEEVIAELSK